MQKICVVKIGGEIVDNPERLEIVLERFTALSGLKILIHGGGRLLSELARKLNIPVIMTAGRRVTDAETLKLVAMVYAGLINKTIVAKLQARDCPAVGLSGTDGRSVLAEKRSRSEIDYGFAGDIKKINTNFLTMLVENRYVPVLCSLTADANGQLLNTNADTIATETAIAMQNPYDVELHFLIDKPGLLYDITDETTVIDQVDADFYARLRTEGRVDEGMLPKMDNAFRAIKMGIEAVYLTYFSKFPDYATGTKII